MTPRLSSLVSTVTILFVALSMSGAPAQAKAIEIEPPAADETLIYIIRIGRFLGSGTGVWVALNDKTVARLRNKKYTAIRAKAGTLTLNLAAQGMVVGTAQVDDRAGETVYLTWRLGDRDITRVDEVEGKKLLNKYKPMKPIKEVKPNNEEIAALINLERMGFDLMQPATQTLEPDETHAVITFFRHKEMDHLKLGIWSENKYLGELDENQAYEVKVPAGEHYFLASNVGTSVLRAQVEAGRRYLVWLNLGGFILRVKLTPIENDGGDSIEKKLSKVAMVALNADSITPGIRSREEKMSQHMAKIVERARSGDVKFTSVNEAHAY